MLLSKVAQEFGFNIHVEVGDMTSIHMEAGEVSTERYLMHEPETNSVINRL